MCVCVCVCERERERERGVCVVTRQDDGRAVYDGIILTDAIRVLEVKT